MSTMIVNTGFFARRVRRYTPMQIEIAKALYDVFKPYTVFDVGCGIGGYLEGFAKCNCLVSGFDMGYDQAGQFMNEYIRMSTFKWDASDPILIDYKYDLVISIEVAEHIDKTKSSIFCKNVVDLCCGRIILTAAGLGQRGRHHVNCQPQKYWVDKFENIDAKYNTKETKQAIDCINKLGDPFGVCKNLMVFNV